MTTKQTIKWTVCPNGVRTLKDGTRMLRLSVYVSPQLETTAPSGVLGEYPDFMGATLGDNWASTVQSLQFSLMTSTGVGIAPLTFAASRTSVPEPDLWDSFFTSSTPIKQFKPIAYATLKPAATFSAAKVFSAVKTQYMGVAKAPAMAYKPPSALRLVQLAGVTKLPLVNILPTPILKASSLRALAASPTPVQDTNYKAFEKFHAPFPKPTVPLPVYPPMDFHKMCTALSNYPGLMRRLGLVIDLEVPYSKGMSGMKLARLKVVWADGRSSGASIPVPRMQTSYTHYDVRPWSAAALPLKGLPPKPVGFSAVSRDGQISGGYLIARSISNPALDPVSLFNVDTDLAAARLLSTAVDTAAVIDRISTPVTRLPGMMSAAAVHAEAAGAAPSATLPALGQSIISMTVNGAASRVYKQAAYFGAVEAALLTNTQDQKPLYAEDLSRGYRVDVWDSQTRLWHKLCGRVGTYALNGTPIMWDGSKPTLADEGWVQVGGVSAPDNVVNDGPPSDMRIHESLFDWSGWSLACPKPGAALAEPDADYIARAKKEVIGPDGKPYKLGHFLHPDLPLDTIFTVPPGELPRLRFGTTYRFRARSVDVCGNSISFSKGTTTADPGGTGDANPLVSRAIVHKRFDPVKPPDVVMAQAPKRGESPFMVVVRSYTDPVTKLKTTQDTARHILPPRTSVQMAETFSGLDDATNADKPLTTALWSELCARDAAKPIAVDNAVMPTVPSPVGYLPDLFSRGASFSSLPGVGASVATRSLGTSARISGARITVSGTQTATVATTRVGFDPVSGARWFDKRPFELVVTGIEGTDTRLAERDTPAVPAWSDSKRVLAVELPKAEEIAVGLSSYATPADLNRMGVYQWGLEPHLVALSQIVTPAIPRLALSASAAAPPINTVPTSPAATLPVTVNQLISTTLIGENWLLTPKVDMSFVHAVDQPMIQPKFTSKAHVERRQGETHATLIDWMAIHGKSTSKLDVKAEWTENVDDPSAGAPRMGDTAVKKAAHVFTIPVEKADKTILNAASPVPGSMVPSAWSSWQPVDGQVIDQMVYVGGRFRFRYDAKPQRHFFGDTKHRKVNYTAIATTRFAQYFTDIPGVMLTSETPSAKVLHVPSSERPAKPVIKYIIPTFGWTRGTGTSTRAGGGLRVYLERPWFSSGDDEKLGVVCYMPNAGTEPPYRADLAPFVAQWGKDPIYGTPHQLPDTYLRPAAFKNRTASEGGLKLKEFAAGSVWVAAFNVEYDAETGSWFSDIQIDAGKTYYPFVKLALARYQPYAIKGLELSPVAIADFVQLTPDRFASASVASDGVSLNVTVAGHAYNASYSGKTVKVTASIEEAVAGTPGTLDWAQVPDYTYTLQKRSLNLTQILMGETRTFWGGTILKGLPVKKAGYVYRVVVREYEYFKKYQTIGTAERLVYAEAIPIAY